MKTIDELCAYLTAEGHKFTRDGAKIHFDRSLDLSRLREGLRSKGLDPDTEELPLARNPSHSDHLSVAIADAKRAKDSLKRVLLFTMPTQREERIIAVAIGEFSDAIRQLEAMK